MNNHTIRRFSPIPLLLFSLFFACRQTPPAFEREAEKLAVLKVVAEETETYYRQDYPGWRATYLDTSYFRMIGYWDGWPHKIEWRDGFTALDTVKKKQFASDKTIWKGSTETRSNENLRINGDMAWYTFDQDSWEKDTEKFLGRSKELRILEKHDGQWKIVYLGYYYLPMETATKE
jgi:hypothetical protein